MLHNSTEGVEEALKSGKITGYIGFDPTAPSLTIGNYVQVMILKLFQQYGHQPVVLMGGATGRIGDPSGKDKERELLSEETLDRNLQHQVNQFRRLLNFEEGENAAILVNNLDFYQDMNVLHFLRDAGKTLTVNYMLAKDSVKNRIEKGLSFTEFSYQLLQAYDFQCLYQKYDCVLQMGGSDQWGNITSGTEFIRRNAEGKAHAITTPLLTKADGSKFGKSTAGNIWLDPDLTSPYKFYQFWINADDRDVPKFLRYFSLNNQDEISALEASHQENMPELKRILGRELTERIHGEDQYEAVVKVSELIFNRRATPEFLQSLDASDWQAVAAEIPSFSTPSAVLADGVSIVDFLTEATDILPSKGEARRAVKGNAISVNKVKINALDYQIDTQQALSDGYFMIENGKKNKMIVRLT